MRVCPRCGMMSEETHCPMDGAPTHPTHGGGGSGVYEAPPVNEGQVIIDRYRLGAPIGRAGAVWLFRAVDEQARGDVTLAFLPPEMGRPQKTIDRFVAKARPARRLEHANTLRLFELGTSEIGCPFVVLEAFRGKTVRAQLQASGAFTLVQSVRIALQVCGSLDEAHDRGVVHAQLRPECVILRTDGATPDEVKVALYGVGAFVNAELQHVSTGNLARLPGAAYRAPEQIREQSLDARTDIYALGVLLHEMLVGLPPYAADSDSGLLGQQARGLPEQPPQGAGGELVSLGIWNAIRAMLAYDPDDRPAGATHVIYLLNEVLAGKTPHLTPSRPALQTVTPPPPPQQLIDTDTIEPLDDADLEALPDIQPDSNDWVVWLAVFLLVAAAIVAVATAFD